MPCKFVQPTLGGLFTPAFKYHQARVVIIILFDRLIIPESGEDVMPIFEKMTKKLQFFRQTGKNDKLVRKDLLAVMINCSLPASR